MTSETISVTSTDGTTIAVDRAGHGPAVVLVHGGPTDHWSNAGVASLLAEHFTVYNYDRRGRGASGDTAPWALGREVEDLDAVIAAAGGSACVYGTSGGAVFALQAAAAGSSITKLVLWEPPFVVDDSRPAIPADYTTTMESLVGAGRNGDALEYFFVTGVGMPAEMVEFMKAAPFWAGMETMATGLLYDTRIIGDFTVPANLTKITTPTVVIDGGTASWTTAAADAVAAALVNATRQTLAGQPHNVADDAIAPAIIALCAGGTL